MGELLREFKQGQNVALDDLGSSILELALNGNASKTLDVAAIESLSLKFKN